MTFPGLCGVPEVLGGAHAPFSSDGTDASGHSKSRADLSRA